MKWRTKRKQFKHLLDFIAVYISLYFAVAATAVEAEVAVTI